MSVYRETDPRILADIGAHLGLATALLDQFVAIPNRMVVAKREQLRELEHEARTAWESMWDQLGQARDLVRALGRDVEPYDLARTAAGDIWLDAARVDIDAAYGSRTTYRWRTAPVGPAQTAIAALRDAVPEVVISEPPPQNLQLQPFRKRVEKYGPLAVVTALVGWVIWQFLA